MHTFHLVITLATALGGVIAWTERHLRVHGLLQKIAETELYVDTLQSKCKTWDQLVATLRNQIESGKEIADKKAKQTTAVCETYRSIIASHEKTIRELKEPKQGVAKPPKTKKAK